MAAVIRCAAMAFVLSGTAVAAPKAPPPPPRPAFTAVQAAQGAQVYAGQCAMCHGHRLEGTLEIPALTGKFIANWAGRPLADLPAYLVRAMPQFAPGSLPPEDAARLTAFILSANGYAAGPTPFTSLTRVALPPPPPLSQQTR